MPKMKTHSGAKKRFRVTGGGKLMHKKANNGHLMEKKTSRRARRLEKPAQVAKQDVRKVKQLLGR